MFVGIHNILQKKKKKLIYFDISMRRTNKQIPLLKKKEKFKT